MRITTILTFALLFCIVNVSFAFTGGLLGKDKNPKKSNDTKLSLNYNSTTSKELTLRSSFKTSFFRNVETDNKAGYVVKTKLLLKKGSQTFIVPVKYKITANDKLTYSNIKKIFKK
jgi:hypothetical protein